MITRHKGSSIFLQLLSLLKLVRVLRLGKLITHLNIKNEYKTSLRLVKLLFFIVLFVHCLGCAWFKIVTGNKEWIPPLDYVWVGTDFFTQTIFYQY